MDPVCTLCHQLGARSEQPSFVQGGDRLCAACIAALAPGGPMAQAYRLWCRARETSEFKFGYLCAERDHLYFHAQGWRAQYTDAEAEDRVTVEHGVVFCADHADTYFAVRDARGNPQTFSYDLSVRYGLIDFWTRLDTQQSSVAKKAYDIGWRDCLKCKGHVHDEVAHEHVKMTG